MKDSGITITIGGKQYTLQEYITLQEGKQKAEEATADFKKEVRKHYIKWYRKAKYGCPKDKVISTKIYSPKEIKEIKMAMTKNARRKLLRTFMSSPGENFSYEDLHTLLVDELTIPSLRATTSKFVTFFGSILTGDNIPYIERFRDEKTKAVLFKWNAISLKDVFDTELEELYSKFLVWEAQVRKARLEGRPDPKPKQIRTKKEKSKQQEIDEAKLLGEGMVEDFDLDEEVQTVLSNELPREVKITVTLEGAIKFLFGILKE